MLDMEQVTDRECPSSPCLVAVQTVLYLALDVVISLGDLQLIILQGSGGAGSGLDRSIMLARCD